MNQLVLYTLRVMEWERQVSRIPLVHVLARCSSAPKLLSATAAQSISSQQWNKAIYTSAWLLSSGHALPPIQLLCIFVERQQAVLGTRSHLQRRAPQTVKLSKAFGMYLWFSSIFKSAFLRKSTWQCLGMTEKPISCLHVKAKRGWDPKAISAGVLWREQVLSRVFMRLSQVEWKNVEPDPEGWRFLWGYKPLLPKKEREWYFFPSFLACCLTPKWEHDCIGSPAYWLLFPVLASVFTASLVEFLSSVRIWHSAALPRGAIEPWPLPISGIIRDPKAAGSATIASAVHRQSGGGTRDLNPK